MRGNNECLDVTDHFLQKQNCIFLYILQHVFFQVGTSKINNKNNTIDHLYVLRTLI